MISRVFTTYQNDHRTALLLCRSFCDTARLPTPSECASAVFFPGIRREVSACISPGATCRNIFSIPQRAQILKHSSELKPCPGKWAHAGALQKQNYQVTSRSTEALITCRCDRDLLLRLRTTTLESMQECRKIDRSYSDLH